MKKIASQTTATLTRNGMLALASAIASVCPPLVSEDEEHDLDGGEPGRDVPLRLGRQAAREIRYAESRRRHRVRSTTTRTTASRGGPRPQTQDTPGREPEIFPGATFVFVEKTMIGRKTSPMPPSARRSQPRSVGRSSLAAPPPNTQGAGSPRLPVAAFRSPPDPLQCWITRWQIGW
jgi:hypothetical protein